MLDSILIKTAQGKIKTATLNQQQSDFNNSQTSLPVEPEKKQPTSVSIKPNVSKPVQPVQENSTPQKPIQPVDSGFSHFKKESTQEILEKLKKPSKNTTNQPEKKSEIVKPQVQVPSESLKKETPTKIPENKVAPEETMPAFYFDLDDEQEVSNFRNKEKVNLQKNKNALIQDLISQTILQANLNSDNLDKLKLSRVLESYFRGVRTEINLKQAIQDNKINLSEKDLEMLISSAKKIKKDFDDNKIKIPEAVEEKKEEVKKVIEKPVADGEPAETIEIKKEISKPVVENKPQNFTPQNKIPGKILKNSEGIHNVSNPVKPKIFQKPAQPQSTFQSAQNIRRVAGPTEELASYDLTNFRALNPEPKQALQKIQEKLDLLQEESYEKKSAGVRAWYTSPIYKQYLILGQESMESEKTVKEIIEQRKKINSPTLSYAEFEAIVDFNAELAY